MNYEKSYPGYDKGLPKEAKTQANLFSWLEFVD